MYNNKYVISIRVLSCYGRVFAENEYCREFAQYDSYSGSFSTGYPCFGSSVHAMKFDTHEKALNWWKKEKKYLINALRNPNMQYDISTLAIHKIKISYTEVEKLSIYEEHDNV